MSRAKKIAEAVAALQPGDVVWYTCDVEPATVCTSCGHAKPASPALDVFAMVQTVHDDTSLTLKLGVVPSDIGRRDHGALAVLPGRVRRIPGRHVSRVPHNQTRDLVPGTWRLL